MNSQDDNVGKLRGVFAVPPLARKLDAARSLDFAENEKIVEHIAAGGITRLIYGGNAFVYHLTSIEFAQLLEWLSTLNSDLLIVPGFGPTYGRAMDQAVYLKRHDFPCVMMLPCADPRDASGLEQGYREISDAAEKRLLVYLKEETNFGTDKDRGLDAIARLVDDGICVGIKYAVVRDDPNNDPYLESLLTRIDRNFVISGIGERPAVTHLRDWKLPGFTTGSGCIAPRSTQLLFEACANGDFEAALKIRSGFIPLEDLRDNWGPARVLHHAVDLCQIATAGPIPPYVSSLSPAQLQQLEPVARELKDRNEVPFLAK